MDAKPKFKASDLATMTHMSREFVIYQIEENELDRLNSGYTSLHFSLFGIAVGALLLAVTTLRTVKLSDQDHTMYFCLSVMAGVSVVYFGFMSIRDYRNAKKECARIKDRSKPVG